MSTDNKKETIKTGLGLTTNQRVEGSVQDETNNTNNNNDNTNTNEDLGKILEWVNQLKDPNTRVNSLIQLSKKREAFTELAVYLWYTPGVISILLQEIIDTYKLLAPPNLTVQESNHTCNVLALFQCIAAHAETRPHLLSAQIPIFLYPFLNTVNKNKPFEYLRLTALGVIGALVKVDNSDVINFLLTTEIIPLCLRIMERGSELSKTVATFIVQRILLDDNGLNYVCNTAERFYAVSSVLLKMINSNPTSRLIKHIVRCYARLSENPRVSSILKENLPACFKDKIFVNSLDDSSRKWIQSLVKNLVNNNQTKDTSKNLMPNTGVNSENFYAYNPNPYSGFMQNPRFDPYYYNAPFEDTSSSSTTTNNYSNNLRPTGNGNYYAYEAGKNNKN